MVVRKNMKPAGCYPKASNGGVNDTEEVPSGFPGFKKKVHAPRATACLIKLFKKAHIRYEQQTVKKEVVTIRLQQYGVMVMLAPLWNDKEISLSKSIWRGYKEKQKQYIKDGWEVLLINDKLQNKLGKMSYLPTIKEAKELKNTLIPIPTFNKEETKKHNLMALDGILKELAKR